MTEEEWLINDSSHNCLEFLRSQHRVPRTSSGRRRLRLFACGSCRQFWQFLIDSRLRAAVEIAEKYADGFATAIELEAAQSAARPLCHGNLTADSRGHQDRIAAVMAVEAASNRAYRAALYSTALPFPSIAF